MLIKKQNRHFTFLLDNYYTSVENYYCELNKKKTKCFQNTNISC